MMGEMYKAYYQSPIGMIEITGNTEGILGIGFTDQITAAAAAAPDCLKDCVRQLDEYFQGTWKEFTLRLLPQGTPFQMKVWHALQAVPYGRTASYKDIAAAVGSPKAVRAVGGANHRNKIAILIPCHRIIGKNGTLTGYGGGLWRKEWLLGHEQGKSKV